MSDGDADGDSDFEPTDPEEKEVGREMVDQSTGLGSVAAHLYRGEWNAPSAGATDSTPPRTGR